MWSYHHDTQAKSVSGKPTPNSKPDDHLTPEESARKLDILEAIDAIPVKDMPGSLKPLARRLISRSGYGQGLCWASYNTLAKETGLSRSMVRLQIADLLGFGWYEFAGRHHSDSKHAKPEFKVATRMVKYLRSYLERLPVGIPKVASTSSNQVASTSSNQVASTSSNKPVSSTGPKNRVDEPPGRPDVRYGTAPSVPAGEKSGGKGPSPLSPSASTDGEILSAHDPLNLRRAIVEEWVRDALTKFAGDFERARIELMTEHGNDPVNRQLIEDTIAKRKGA